MALYNELFAIYGNTEWWPGESDDEVIVGAILTQNTAWSNVEKSLKNIRQKGLMELDKLRQIEPALLVELIRSSGFYKQKSKTILEVASQIIENFGSIEAMKGVPLEELERFLRPIRGIGQETMDAILCYALDKPVFVVDKYTMRLLGRIGVENTASIGQVKRYVFDSLGMAREKLKNFHGLIVGFAKDYCRSKPLCKECPLNKKCDYGSGS